MAYIGGYADGYGGLTQWRWRDITELAPPEDARGEEVYSEQLQGKQVDPTLRAAAGFLKSYYQDKWPLLG